MEKVLDCEVNFLTEEEQLYGLNLCRVIKTEFDLIRSWQGMGTVFGFGARSVLDNFIALSLRKMLCDKGALILKVCPDFKMPRLSGSELNCPGEESDMRLIEINPSIRIKPESEWIMLNEWLDERIAWIEKNVNDIPDAYSNRFYKLIKNKLSSKEVESFFECKKVENDIIWYLKNPVRDKQRVYDILKNNGYYDLTIRTLIRNIADKYCAHIDDKRSIWIRMANSSSDISTSAISAFATQMIYAATKQIEGLKDYYIVPQMMEIVDIQ